VKPERVKISFPIYGNLDRINRLSTDEAESFFLECCSSKRWAERMAAARPFPMLEHLFFTARRIWNTLEEVEVRRVLEDESDTERNSSFVKSEQGVKLSMDGAMADRSQPNPAISGKVPVVGLRFAAVRHYRKIESRLSSRLEI
jgi:hypothetical protein